MNQARIEAEFEAHKNDHMRDDAVPHKAGPYLFLCAEDGDMLTQILIDEDIIGKVKNWCNRARYRCTKLEQVVGIQDAYVRGMTDAQLRRSIDKFKNDNNL